MSVYTDLNQILSNEGNSFDNFSVLIDNARYRMGDFKNGTHTFSSHFDNYAKPLSNLEKVKVDTNIINDVNNKFRERRNITASIIDDLSDIIDLKVSRFDDKFHSDFYVKDLESVIDVTFITEGAGYKNVLGYYFYRIADGSTMTVNGQSYQTYDGQPLVLSGVIDGNDYTPTFIFPNASKKNSGGNLLQGHKRRLHGNRSNGTFQNVNIGFFLVPNGWGGTSSLVRYNNKPIIHSTPRMNHNWDDVADQLTNSFIENNGYQSLFIQYPTSEGNKNVLAIEDISRPGGDKDFNDAIFIAEIDNDFDNADKFSDVTDETTDNGSTNNKVNVPINKISVSESKMMTYGIEGIFANILKNDVTDFDVHTDATYCLVHRLFCVNATWAESIDTLLNSLTFDSDITMSTTRSTNLVTIQYEIPYSVMNDNIVTIVDNNNNSIEEFQVQLMNPFDNYVGEEPSDNLLDLQHRLFNSEIVVANEYDFVRKGTPDVTTVTRTTSPTRLDSTVLIWGDPHVTTIHGIRYVMDHREGIFPVFVNEEFVINGEFWKPDPAFDYTYFKKLSFATRTLEGIRKYIIDLEFFKVYDATNGTEPEELVEIVPEHKNIEAISNIHNESINIYSTRVPRVIDLEHPHIVDPSNPIDAIVLKYGKLDIVCNDYRFNKDLMNQIDFDFTVLTESNYKSRAHGVLVKRQAENYTNVEL